MSRLDTPAASTYRPLSALALVSLFFSLPAPLIFIWNQVWFLLLSPGVGLILGVLARRHIRRSQGRLGGQAVAAGAIVLSVACGLGWLTMLATEQYVLAAEAETFLREWIATLQEKDKEGEVFLGTLEPKGRQIDFHPGDIRKLRAHFPPPRGTNIPQFDAFRANPFMATLLRYPGQFRLEPLGRQGNIAYEPGSYSVKFAYRLECPVTAGEVQFTLKSQEFATRHGPRREWYVVLNDKEPELPREPTPYGKELFEARRQAEYDIRQLLLAVHRDQLDGLAPLFAAASQSALQTVIDFLRRDVPPKKPSRWQGYSAMLLQDAREGADGWRLRYRLRIINDKQEMEFEITLVRGPGAASDRWHYTDYKFLNFRKRRELEGAGIPMAAPGGGAGAVPQEP